MRIVILPVTTFPDVWRESEWLMYYRMARVWVERNTDVFVYLVTPETNEDLPQIPRIKYIFEKWNDCFYEKMSCSGGTFLELFNPRWGKFVIDAVVTSRTIAAAQISRVLMDYRQFDDSLPLFVRELKTVDFGEAHQSISHLEIAARILGYCFSYPIFDTPLEKEIALGAARRYLTPEWVREFLSRSLVNPCGIGCGQLDNATRDIAKREKFTCLFGGRLNYGSKRFEKTLGMMNRFFSFGRDIGCVLCYTKRATFTEYLKEYSHLELFGQCPTWEFWKVAKSCHVFISYSAIEGFTVGVMEMLYLGLIGLLPDAPWVKGLFLDRYNDYPFIHRNDEECLALLRYSFENYEEARAKISWVPEWIRERYNCWDTNQRELAYIREKVNDYRIDRLWSEVNVELLQETLDYFSCDSHFTLNSFWDELTSRAKFGPKKNKKPYDWHLTRWSVHHWLLHHGFTDTCCEASPTYERGT